jgi:hypothetical protein
MPDIPLPEDLSTYIRGMESRIRALETAPRAQDTQQPWASGFVETQEGTSSTANTDLATVGPEVTVRVGQTNRVLITIASSIELPGNHDAAIVLTIDGLLPITPEFTLAPVFALNRNADMIAGSYSTVRSFTSAVFLPEGLHTFRMQYRKVSGAGFVFFANRFLMIQTF